MAVSKRLRFEVLRRDDHTCQYCGETAPGVTLHVDHVIPVSLGGSNNPGNLVAACKDCNAGKTSVPAGAPLVQKVNAHAAAYALALTDKMTRIRGRLEKENECIEQFEDLWKGWQVASTGKSIPRPDDYKDALRKWCHMGVPLDLIEYAIEVAMSKRGLTSDHGEFRYMAGVVWRTLDNEEAPYELTEEKVAVYTQSEHEDGLMEASIDSYQMGHRHALEGRTASA